MSQALTMTVTPSTLAIAVSGDAVSGNVHPLTVTNAEGDWEDHEFLVTVKGPGKREGAPLVEVDLDTPTGANLTGTLDLNGAGVARALRDMGDGRLLVDVRDVTVHYTLGLGTLTIYNPVQR